jgi:hypothetical protein
LLLLGAGKLSDPGPQGRSIATGARWPDPLKCLVGPSYHLV